MTNNSPQALVNRLIDAGAWPDPQLLEDILAQGDAAVLPLINFVRQEDHRWPEDESIGPLDFTVNLLCSLGAVEAIPDLIGLFEIYDDDMLDDWSARIGSLGPGVVTPALTVAANRDLWWFQRAMAAEAAMMAAGDDPVLRTRIGEVLRAELADYVEHAATLTENDYCMASSLVTDLASLAYETAHALIHQAYDLDIVYADWIDEATVDDLYAQGGEPPRSTRENWLQEYKDQYKKRGLTPPSAVEALLKPAKPMPVRSLNPLGRNEPCWCGSGKKYKNCHMREDEAKEKGRLA